MVPFSPSSQFFSFKIRTLVTSVALPTEPLDNIGSRRATTRSGGGSLKTLLSKLSKQKSSFSRVLQCGRTQTIGVGCYTDSCRLPCHATPCQGDESSCAAETANSNSRIMHFRSSLDISCRNCCSRSRISPNSRSWSSSDNPSTISRSALQVSPALSPDSANGREFPRQLTPFAPPRQQSDQASDFRGQQHLPARVLALSH